MEIDLGYSRSAKVVWEGSLEDGQGEMTSESGALGSQPLSFYARVNHPKRTHQTTPEELLAAACASDFAMVLAALLGDADHPPTRLAVSAVCTLERLVEGGFKLASLNLNVLGQVPGVEDAEFLRIARDVSEACPSLAALRQGIDIYVEAALGSE